MRLRNVRARERVRYNRYLIGLTLHEAVAVRVPWSTSHGLRYITGRGSGRPWRIPPERRGER